MKNWLVIHDADLKGVYHSLPPACFRNERWFSDRDAKDSLVLVETLQFQRTGAGKIFFTLNLFDIGEGQGYYYYIPFLIFFGSPWFTREHMFEKDGYYFFDGIETYEYISLLEELWRGSQKAEDSGNQFQFLLYNNYLKNTKFHLHGSTSNSLLFVSNNYLIKNYRRIYPGVNPELKICSALAKMGSDKIPELYGSFQYLRDNEFTLGIVQEVVANNGTCWDIWGDLLKEPGSDTILLKQAVSLGEVLADLHGDLASIAEAEGTCGPLDFADIQTRIRAIIQTLEDDLATHLKDDLTQALDGIRFLFSKLSGKNLGSKFLIHGDLHLEQVLATSTGWKVLDFEGEPLKTIEEREQHDSPLKDLASIFRSVSYRIHLVFDNPDSQAQAESLLLTGLITGYTGICHELKETRARACYLPEEPEFELLLIFFQIERAVYECIYELKCRPDWFHIPFHGLTKLLNRLGEMARENDALVGM